ncbi:GSCOCG00006706001-RA-CDS [Cotesia congregata]|nr:GSCOCG00006706001-RA-CDS [Cotesia congregata]
MIFDYPLFDDEFPLLEFKSEFFSIIVGILLTVVVVVVELIVAELVFGIEKFIIIDVTFVVVTAVLLSGTLTGNIKAAFIVGICPFRFLVNVLVCPIKCSFNEVTFSNAALQC